MSVALSEDRLANQHAVNEDLSAAILNAYIFSGSAVGLMIQMAKTLDARGTYRPIITATSAPNLGGVDHVLSNYQSILSQAFREERLPCRGERLIGAKSNVFGDLTATSQDIGIQIGGVPSLIQVEMRSSMLCGVT